MNPQVDKTSALGLPQPGSDISQLPSIRVPQTFRAPENAASQFDVSVPQTATAPPVPTGQSVQAAPRTLLNDPIAAANAQFAANDAMAASQADDADTPFDEEWVAKAKEVIQRTGTDPFAQSKELSKLKAQYIKTRYNKDIKVSEG